MLDATSKIVTEKGLEIAEYAFDGLLVYHAVLPQEVAEGPHMAQLGSLGANLEQAVWHLAPQVTLGRSGQRRCTGAPSPPPAVNDSASVEAEGARGQEPPGHQQNKSSSRIHARDKVRQRLYTLASHALVYLDHNVY